jgi:methionyl-tRNA formyltransferase
MAGDAKTGVCIMQMEAGLDTGPVLLRDALDIGPSETTAGVHDRLRDMGARMIVEALDQIATLVPEPQPDERVIYAEKIDKAEARIDWTQPARQIDRQIRGLSPFPGAWFVNDGVRIKVLGSRLADGSGEAGTVIDSALHVACGDGAIALTRLQKAGKGAQDVEVFQRGSQIAVGTDLNKG